MRDGEKSGGAVRRRTFAAAAAFAFLSSFDTGAGNLALPEFAAAFGAGAGTAAWAMGAYLISLAVFTLPFGGLGDRLGRGAVFRRGVFAFSAASVLGGLARNFPVFLAARAVQGAGAAAAIANSQGMLAEVFPQEERGRAFGGNGAFSALGALAGPALGGLLLPLAGWRWLFWVGVPVGVLAWVAVPRLPRRTVPEGRDIAGNVLFALAAGLLLFALERASAGGFGSPLVLLCLVCSGVLLPAFFRRETRAAHPMLDPVLLRSRRLRRAVLRIFVSFAAFSAAGLVLPFYLRGTRGMNPGEAGAFLEVCPLMLAVAAPAGGALADRFGPEKVAPAGLAAMGAGLFLTAGLGGDAAGWEIVLFLGIYSFGDGLFLPANSALVMSLLPKEKLGLGGSMNAFARNIGMAAGVAAASAGLGGSARNAFGVKAVCLTAGFACAAAALLPLLRAAFGRAGGKE